MKDKVEQLVEAAKLADRKIEKAKQGTGIEWTHVPDRKGETWNPVTGCSKVSEGCRNCYAMKDAHRLAGNPNPKVAAAYQGLTKIHEFAGAHRPGKGRAIIKRLDWTGKVRLVPEKLEEPLRWRKPRRVFVNSMSDLFHEDVPIEFIADVFNVMASGLLTRRKRKQVLHDHEDECWVPNPHTFQVLTKRPTRMLEVLDPGGELEREVSEYWPGDSPISSAMEAGEKFKTWPLPNVWLGVSVEDQEKADERIPLLLQTPAVVRFVSYEPALGPVDFSRWLHPTREIDVTEGSAEIRPNPHSHVLDWVICGGESGPNARPCNVQHIRTAVEQCQAAGVPVFVKQLGRLPGFHLADEEARGNMMPSFHHADKATGLCIKSMSDGKGKDMAEWPEELRVRQFPAAMGQLKAMKA